MNIQVIKDSEGKIKTDFKGFKGEACIKEASDLLKALKRLGVNVDVKDFRRKDDAAALTETRVSEC